MSIQSNRSLHPLYTERYQTETREMIFQGKTITLENMTPVLSPRQREKRKQEIEKSLFEVFRKYSSGTQNQ